MNSETVGNDLFESLDDCTVSYSSQCRVNGGDGDCGIGIKVRTGAIGYSKVHKYDNSKSQTAHADI